MHTLPSTSSPLVLACSTVLHEKGPQMDTNELIQAAAVIAGQLAAQSFNAGNISPAKIQEIARTAVTIAREIESEARASYG